MTEFVRDGLADEVSEVLTKQHRVQPDVITCSLCAPGASSAQVERDAWRKDAVPGAQFGDAFLSRMCSSASVFGDATGCAAGGSVKLACMV